MHGWKNIIRLNTKKWRNISGKDVGTWVVPVGKPAMLWCLQPNLRFVTSCWDRNITVRNLEWKVQISSYRTVLASDGHYLPLQLIADSSGSHHKSWTGVTNLSTEKANIPLPSGYGRESMVLPSCWHTDTIMAKDGTMRIYRKTRSCWDWPHVPRSIWYTAITVQEILADHPRWVPYVLLKRE